MGDHFYDFLETRGAQIPPELKNRDVTKPNGPDERVQQEILRLYKNSPECSILFELMTDFDEGLQEWRYRHVKLVERTIGAKKGTGGSPGVPFLKESLFRPVFHDLWAIRHEMCPRTVVLRNAEARIANTKNYSRRNSRTVPEKICAFSFS